MEKYVNETPRVLPKEAAEVDWEKKLEASKSVSYTHLTLPTIYSV